MVELKELRKKFEQNGIPAYRANQVFQAIYNEGKMAYSQMSVLPTDVRMFLDAHIPIMSIGVISENISTHDKSHKVLFELQDGEKIEAVLMRFKDGRKTVCVSSQVGCTLGCKFCATGKLGFKRNLTYEEITDQVLYFQLRLIAAGERVDHIVYMGMGEPFLNYENVMKSIHILNDKMTFNIGMRHITVSTSGIIPGIQKFTKDGGQVNLAVSLHAHSQEVRASIMPIAKRYPLDDLMKACERYIEKTHRRISYEYIMLSGINDSEKDAYELANLLRGQLCHVNLIPYNDTKVKDIQGTPKRKIEHFQSILETHRIPVTVRVSLGKDIAAACGQLAAKKKACNLEEN
ncbi:23S rRNA (adenine(2503)-C(2))-methyltransferase RlmN [Patescibacteria group bacterium]|nr:23S rRNA (adenine(2503)-C(2))-methyltransferase RlmN [Patescibacteria group bacterium]